MPTVSARIGVVAIALIALFPPTHAARAFGLNFGPLHLNLPFPGGPRRGDDARTGPGAAGAPQPDSPTLLYPVLAWSSLYGDIFWPKTASFWSFGYEDIFDQAFTKYPPERVAEFCPYRDTTAEVVGRIARQTTPDAAQQPLLQKLATALGQANGYLTKACPTEIPPQPVARLQLMENQINTVIMALEIVRPPLQEFEQSLSDKQRARFDQASATTNDIAPACRMQTGSTKESLAQVEQAVQPTDAQRKALAKVEDAFNRAASDLDADCPGAVSPTALGRLEATEARLDATWRAVETIEVALADFQTGLTDQQNIRFNALQLASTR
jgi:hypothetical protein